MYFESDYVMRQIAMMGELFKRLMRLCDEQKAEDAHELLNALSEKELSFPLSTIAELPLENLQPLLTDAQRIILAEVIFMDSEVMAVMGDMEAAAAMRRKILPAILAAAKAPEIAAHSYVRVKLLADELTAALTLNQKLELVGFYILCSHYDDAEDALYACLEDLPPDSLSNEIYNELKETGLSFYGQLEGLSEGELLAGGFSGAEVSDGLALWSSRF